MKLYRNLVEAVVKGLLEIFTANAYADKVIERILKSDSRWGARDRAFIAETIYDIVRNYKFLYEKYGHLPAGEYDWWQITGLYLRSFTDSLPEWKEWDPAQINIIFIRDFAEAVEPSVLYSVPDWLYDRIHKELSPLHIRYIEALHMQAPLYIRANTLKGSIGKLGQLFSQKGISYRPIKGNCMEIIKRYNIFSDSLFKEGLFEIQDLSSQQVAPFCNVKPGMRVIDACSGAGGKTLHLAALMKNEGKIIALDTEAYKLKELDRRAKRAGAAIIETRLIKSTKTIKRLENNADHLLLDVPCSGTGVFKRNPDAKWKLSPDFIERVLALQRDILTRYPIMCKPGGLITYVTCSILKSENEDQVRYLLDLFPGHFEIISEQRIFPWDGGDGFYMANILKK